jgi:hypothetical protein
VYIRKQVQATNEVLPRFHWQRDLTGPSDKFTPQ